MVVLVVDVCFSVCSTCRDREALKGGMAGDAGWGLGSREATKLVNSGDAINQETSKIRV